MLQFTPFSFAPSDVRGNVFDHLIGGRGGIVPVDFLFSSFVCTCYYIVAKRERRITEYGNIRAV